MYHTFRIRRGQDLYQTIEDYVMERGIQAGIMLSGVGCVYKMNIRLADGESTMQKDAMYEIVSMTGTLSPDFCHLHISFSDITGQTIGGHLLPGCIVNTTAEICLLEFMDRTFEREFDEETGYDELVIKMKGMLRI